MNEPEELTIRERLFVKNLMTGMSVTAAMKNAGYAKSVAEKQQRRILDNPRIKKLIRDSMACAGLTADSLAATMKAGLEAINDKGLPDYSTRHKYLETALRVGGYERDSETSNRESYEDSILRRRGRPR